MARASKATIAVFGLDGGGGGSGVLITPDGYALTNFHVTSACGDHMRCGLSDGRMVDAVIVGIDATGDVSLIKLLGSDDFPVAPMADSEQVRVGQWCFAVGNPFGLATNLQPSVSLGLVSGTGRYQYPAGTLLEYADCIQTDAAINPGNSGGPLFNLDGEVIGINGRCSFEKRGRINVGVGYAISINQIKNFLGMLRSGRLVDHATLGATVSTDDRGKVLVSNILNGSDAYRRGLRYGDEIVSFAGREIQTTNDFKNVLGTLPKDWRVPLVIPNAGNVAATRELCAPTVFRSSFSNWQPAYGMGLALGKQGVKRAAWITWDYAAGNEAGEGFREGLRAGGGEVVRELKLPFPETNFQPLLAQVPGLGVEAVGSFFAGGGAVQFVREYAAAGLKERVPLCGSGFLTEGTLAAQGAAAEGIRTALHYGDGLDNPKNRTFRTAFKEKTTREADVYAVQGYDSAQLLGVGLDATRGDPAAERELVRAMRGARIDSPRGAFTLSPSHNPVQNIYLREAKGGENRVIGIAAEALAELDTLIGLPGIKREVRELANFLKIQGERRRLGLPETPVSLHMVFEGNPGTGKSTLAKSLAARLLGSTADGPRRSERANRWPRQYASLGKVCRPHEQLLITNSNFCM